MTNTPTPAPTPPNPPPPQTAWENSIVLSERKEAKNRESIAVWVLGASIGAVFLISIAVVWAAKEDKRDTVAQQVMSSTLPLYGTWVGTILAFYFSRNAFEAAATASDRNATTFQQVSNSASAPPPPDNKLANILLKSLANDLVFSQNDINKPLQDVIDELVSKGRYRTIVVNAENKYRGLVHRRNASAFLASPDGTPVASKATLENYLDWQKQNQPITVVFLPQSATLADADAKLKETKECKDVIVTTDGGETSPVVVYITQTDIDEYK